MCDNNSNDISRRDFLLKSSVLATSPVINALPFGNTLAAAGSPAKDMLVGIQIPAVSFVDEGVNKVLDILQEKGQVNTLFLTVFTYSGGAGGRQISGFPYPGHGKQEETFSFHGGNFATPHARFYKNTVLKDTKAPDFGNLDILEMVLPETKKRGMKVMPYLYDIWRRDTPNIDKLQEIDLDGNHAISCCAYNPDYKEFIKGLVSDITTSYGIDGLIWGSEHQGPFNNTINGYFMREYDNVPTCFCTHHRKAAEAAGLNFSRVTEGYKKLLKFRIDSNEGKRPVDGYFVEFWRILMDYPEILAYEKVWTDGHNGTYKSIYQTAKGIRKDMHVGFHIWHNNSFHPFYRATQNFDRFAAYADFIKPVVYNVSAGGRYALYINNIGETIFKDLPKDELLKLNNYLLNYNDPMTMDELPKKGLSPEDYVSRETKRALDQVKNTGCQVYPGIDVGIPMKQDKSVAPADVYASTMAALKAGANGLIFSRKYSEMTLENLEAGGRAVKDFKNSV